MWFIDKIREIVMFLAVRKTVQNNPLLKVALVASSDTFNQLPLKNHLSTDEKEVLSGELLKNITEIVSSDDQVMKCRELLSRSVIGYARYLVLIFPPSPEEDTTGFRGLDGVSGELKSHLLEICKTNKELCEEFYGAAENPTQDELWNLALFGCLKWHWWMHTFNAMRVYLNDFNPVEERDWFRPFVHALCAWQEHCYREEIGMPPVLAGEPDALGMNALKYSTFMTMVISGERYPDLAWRKAYENWDDDEKPLE